MAETMRSLFANDSAIARALDGDDDDSDRRAHDSGESDRDDDLEDDGDEKASATLRDTSSIQDSLASDSDRALSAHAAAASARGGSSGGDPGGSFNTGPKGVRADASAFHRATHAASTEKRLLYNAQLERRAMTTTTWSEDQQEADLRERWVEMRLKELSKQKTQGSPVLGGEGTEAGDGSYLRHVDADGFLAVIEREHRVCVVVTDDRATSETQAMLHIMRQIAKRHHRHSPYLLRTCTEPVVFIALSAQEAELDVVAVPAVLGYVDGVLEANLMQVAEEREPGTRITEASMEQVLVKYGVVGVKAVQGHSTRLSDAEEEDEEDD